MRWVACAATLLTLVGRVAAQEQMTVTVTHYAGEGRTYSGAWTVPGVAACSWDFEIGTVIRFRDGREYQCLDRGSGLGSHGWVDLYTVDAAEARRHGRYEAVVEVIRP